MFNMKNYIRVNESGIILMVSVELNEDTVEIDNAPDNLMSNPQLYKYINGELVEIPKEEFHNCPYCGQVMQNEGASEWLEIADEGQMNITE